MNRADRLTALAATVLLALAPIFGSARGAGAVDVRIVNQPDGAYAIEGRFSTAAPSAAAWATLTDYERLDTFVSSIRTSRIVEREEDGRFVEQVMSGNVGWFHKEVHLLLRIEESGDTIRFQDVSGKSFRAYSGTWEIERGSEGIDVVYRLVARPGFFAPDFMVARGFRTNVAELLREVRDEIALRSVSSSS